jgi:hypothetical protein
MQKRVTLINLALIVTMVLALSTSTAVLAQSPLVDFHQSEIDTPPPPPVNPYFSSEQAGSLNGDAITKNIIGSPPKPPEGFTIERNSASLPIPNEESGINSIAEVPAFDWSYGCSPTSGAMIAGYFDRTFFANMYAGPTNGSVAPMNNSIWGAGETPLSATHQGVDGRTAKGHVDDYWIEYGNSDPDPFYGNWPEHSYGDCLGDYMKTNQTTNFANVDGETAFYAYESSGEPLTCDLMQDEGFHDEDGTYGVKLFYESRGYSVSDCYSQRTDVSGGFNF